MADDQTATTDKNTNLHSGQVQQQFIVPSDNEILEAIGRYRTLFSNNITIIQLL